MLMCLPVLAIRIEGWLGQQMLKAIMFVLLVMVLVHFSACAFYYAAITQVGMSLSSVQDACTNGAGRPATCRTMPGPCIMLSLVCLTPDAYVPCSLSGRPRGWQSMTCWMQAMRSATLHPHTGGWDTNTGGWLQVTWMTSHLYYRLFIAC
jgi:hypothetical protein